MTSQTLHLVGGRRLANNRGSWRLDPGGETVDVVIGDGVVTILDPDTGQVLADQVPVAEDKQGRRKASSSSTPGRSKNDARPTPSRGERWATLNSFVDATLADCTEAEVRVWLVLFREVKPGGLARMGMSEISRRAGLTRRGVMKAIGRLRNRGTIIVESRGSINGTPNAYRLLNDEAGT